MSGATIEKLLKEIYATPKDIIARRRWRLPSDAARMSTRPWPRLIGARVARVEDPPLLRGERRFIDDIVVADVLHAGFVRSPHPHAAIRGLSKRRRAGVAGRARGAHARRPRAV